MNHTVKRQTEEALKRTFGVMRTQSRTIGREFDITFDWALQQAERQRFCCALTAIPFFASHSGASRTNPFRPSIDRIDNQRGYTQDNVRLIVFAANVALLDWGEAVFARVARGYVQGIKRERAAAKAFGSNSRAPTRQWIAASSGVEG